MVKKSCCGHGEAGLIKHVQIEIGLKIILCITFNIPYTFFLYKKNIYL